MGSETIQELSAKCKLYIEQSIGEWGVFGLVLLAALGSFGLGRLSILETARPMVTITETAAAALPPGIPIGGEFVASRTGSVYYYPWCSGVAKIAVTNQRWFRSEKEAQAAGYRPAKNCKGLVSTD
ncbi:MAG: Ada metal-binding domain-containing protein [Candidatus Paceibacterota bacterium]